MGIAVYIATTAGPVRIERIVGEAVPQSNVFVGRGYKPLEPVSADYEAFVAPGGPIEKAFGPFETPSFRLDVSGPIDTGNSWELAIFVAHGLAKAGRLAGPGDVADAAVLLTGRVDADLNIVSVGHIDEKVRAAHSLTSDCEARKCPINFFLPDNDAASVGGSLTTRPVAGAVEVMQFLDDMGDQAKPPPTPAVTPEPGAGVGSRTPLLWLAVVLVAGGVGYMTIGGQEGTRENTPKREAPKQNPPKEKVSLKTALKSPSILIFERRPPSGKSCIDVQFGGATAREVPVGIDASGETTSSQLADVCGLRVEVAAADAKFEGVAILRVLSGRYMGQDTAESRTFFEGQAEWLLNLPSRMDAAFRFSVSADARSGGGAAIQLTHQVLQ